MNNIREQVLQKWNAYKEKITKLTKGIEFLGEQTFVETALPSFPLDLNTARRSLDR